MNATTGFAAILFAATMAISVAQAQSSNGQAAPSTTMQSGRTDSLSGKLSESGGVIKPTTDVDPNIQAQSPGSKANKMPVIPPSATGGQNAK